MEQSAVPFRLLQQHNSSKCDCGCGLRLWILIQYNLSSGSDTKLFSYTGTKDYGAHLAFPSARLACLTFFYFGDKSLEVVAHLFECVDGSVKVNGCAGHQPELDHGDFGNVNFANVGEHAAVEREDGNL